MYQVIARDVDTGIIEYTCGVFDTYQEAESVAEFMDKENVNCWHGVENYHA